MWIRFLVVSAALLAFASPVAAQALELDAPGRFEPAAPRAATPDLAAPESVAVSQNPSFALTLGHAFGGYALGLVGGAMAGTLIGGGLVVPFQTVAPLFAGLSIGALAIAPLGAAIGAWGFGGARGSFAASLGLSYLGQGLGAAWFLAFSFGAGEFGTAVIGGALLGVLGSVFGAAIGFDITLSEEETDEPSPTWAIAPYAAPTDRMDGAVLGAAGVF